MAAECHCGGGRGRAAAQFVSVIDASVLVAYFVPFDPAHDAARTWFSLVGRETERVTAPTLLLSEVCGSVARRNGPDDGNKVLRQLLLPGFLDLRPVSASLATTAAALAVRLGLKGCDAIYVALADELKDDLVTLDGEQLRRGGQVVRVVRPG